MLLETRWYSSSKVNINHVKSKIVQDFMLLSSSMLSAS